MQKPSQNMVKGREHSKGYVILFTVLISSIILAIALGISATAYREVTFNLDARDSHYALFAADSAAECALHHLLLTANNPFRDSITGAWLSDVTITCGEFGGYPLQLRGSTFDTNSPDYVFNINADTLNPAGVYLSKGCGIPRVVQTSFGGQQYLRVQGIGYNLTCQALFANATLNSKAVERAIEYTFLLDTTQGPDNQNSGNPINGHGILDISAFNPDSLNGQILSSNTNGGVLGSNSGGSFWGTLTDFFTGLLGINLGNTGSDTNSGNYQGTLQNAKQLDPDLLPSSATNNGSTSFQSSGLPDSSAKDAQPSLYAPEYAPTSSTTSYQKTTTSDSGALYAPDDSLTRLSTGARINTAADNAINLENKSLSTDWFDRFFGPDPEAEILLKQAQLAQQARSAPVSTYDTSVLRVQSLPDGTDKSIAIAATILSRYADLSGDTTILKTVDPKLLVEVAQKMSFDGAAADPDKVRELFKQYDVVNGTSVADQINSELLAKIVTEFASISAPETISVSTPTPIRRVIDFFLKLVGQVPKKVAVVAPSVQNDILVAKNALSAYGDITKDWTTVSAMNPEILSSILSQYPSDGVITEDVTAKILQQYADVISDQTFIKDIDLGVLTTVLNNARLDSRITPAAAISVSITEESMRRALLILQDPTNQIQVPAFTALANTILPGGSVTPEVAKVFLEKYAEASGNVDSVAALDPVVLADVLNQARAITIASQTTTDVQTPVSILTRVRLLFFRLFGLDLQIVPATTKISSYVAFSTPVPTSVLDSIVKAGVGLGISEADMLTVRSEVEKTGFLSDISKKTIIEGYGETAWNSLYEKTKDSIYAAASDTSTTLQQSNQTPQAVLQLLQ